MVTVEAIVRGLTGYLDAEVLPQLPPAKAVMVGTVAALYLRQAPSLIEKIPESMGVRNGQSIDIDAVRDAVKSQMKKPIPIDIPMVGRFEFDETEIDKLYQYIVNSQ